MIFRPFGAKKIKKNWIWKMTPADPPSPPNMEFSIIFLNFFLNPSLSQSKKNSLVSVQLLHLEYEIESMLRYLSKNTFN